MNSVKLIAISKPVIEGITTAEDLICYAARVSNPSNQLNTETGPKLLKYCIEHGHWSVFEIVSCTFEIRTSRAIAAQILRHRSFTFQEFSQRYSAVTEMPAVVRGRKQAEKNRQSSSGELESDSQVKWQQIQAETYAYLVNNYQFAIDKLKVSREQARMLLPLATPTTLYMTGSVRSWIHYLQSRCSEDTQQEHRDVALEVRRLFRAEFPNITSALGW